MADILKRFPKEIEDLINEFNADHRGRFYETLKRIPLYRSFDSIHQYLEKLINNSFGSNATNAIRKAVKKYR